MLSVASGGAADGSLQGNRRDSSVGSSTAKLAAEALGLKRYVCLAALGTKAMFQPWAV